MISDNPNENNIKKKENSQIIQGIYNHINEMLFQHDLDGNFIFTNTYFEEITGYSILELESKIFWDVIPEIHKQEFENYLQRIKSNGYDEGIIHIVTKQGHAMTVKHKSTLLEIPGNPNCVNVICSDITEELKAYYALKQSQKELKEKEKKYRDIFENINAYIYIHDLDGNYIEANFYFIKMMGYSEEELKTRSIKDLMPENYKPNFDEYLNRIKANGYDDGINKLLTKDGSTRVVEYTNSLIYGDNGPIGIRGLAKDITQQYISRKDLELSEKKRVESEKKYRDIFENINEYIYLHDMNGYFVDTNSHFRNNIGFSQGELKKISLREMIPEKYKPEFDEYLKRIKVSGYEKGLLRIVSKGGRELLVEYKNSLVQGFEGPQFVRGVGRDITAEHEARKALEKSEENLRIARDELEKRVQERTKELKESNKRLEEKSLSLEEANITLRVLLTTKHEAKREIEERMLANIKSLILPLLRKMKVGRLGPSQMAYIEMIESNLNQTIAPFNVDIISKKYNLTPTEVQVANLIREGKSSKEIAMLLNTAISTIHTHRDNIRIKLGIKNKKINLRTNLIGSP